ncbi:MAG: SDR family NAD(P)-dependent oxidoreductase [candidate division WOR-3 bacterium]
MDRAYGLEGKVAVVTGAARGLGLEISKVLGEHGAKLIMIDNCSDLSTIPYPMSTEEDFADAVLTLRQKGINVKSYVCDVRDSHKFAAIIKYNSEEGFSPDIHINNVGVLSLSKIEEITEDNWNEILDVCLKGAFLCSKVVIPYMKRKGWGRIINISSVAGLIGLGMCSHYCAAKHGLIGFTKALALELAGSGITVNAICPGTMDSISIKTIGGQLGLLEPLVEHFTRFHLIPGPIPMKEVAGAVCWLSSKYTDHITGSILTIDAGWTAGTK